MKIIENKVVLVTGGANGIGKSIVKKFNVNNNTVIVIDNDKEACDKLKNENEFINFYTEDITNFERIETIVEDIFDKYRNIDILINNVGIQTINPISKLSIDEWNRVLNVNLNANFYLTQLVSNRMKNESTILNITSTHYNKPRTDHAHYDISKAGIAILTKLYALELANRNITVNALAVGATYSKMNEIFEYDKEKEIVAKNKIPMKHICTCKEIADYTYNIIKDFSKHTTGSIFIIDGGRNLIWTTV